MSMNLKNLASKMYELRAPHIKKQNMFSWFCRLASAVYLFYVYEYTHIASKMYELTAPKVSNKFANQPKRHQSREY